MQQVQGDGMRHAGSEAGTIPAYPASTEIGKLALRVLFLAALCAGLVAATISFAIFSREARGELVDVAAHNAQLLDGRLRRALELAARPLIPKLPEGAQLASRLRGPLTADGGVDLQAIVRDAEIADGPVHGFLVPLNRAMLSRGLLRDAPRIGRLDLWIMTTEPMGIWELAGEGKIQSPMVDSAAFLSGCEIKQDTTLAVVQGRHVACAFVPSAASYLLASADSVGFYQPALRQALTLFLLTGLMFLCSVMVAHWGQRRFLGSVFTTADTLRQDVFRRRESIKQLREEAVGHAEARRIAEFGRWATRLREGNFYWHEADDEVARIYGVSRTDLLGTPADSPHNLHPDDRARIADHWSYINNKLFPYMLRYRLVQPGGAVREIMEIGEPWYGIGGELIGFQGVVQDVTGRSLDIAEGLIRPPLRTGTPLR